MIGNINPENVLAQIDSTSIRHQLRQQGISLLEVLITLAILTFGALAIANLQTASSIAVQASADHFKINELGQVIVEQLKADSTRAAAGDYNTEYTDLDGSTSSSAEVSEKISTWKKTMFNSTPNGETGIKCDAANCTVSLKWYELSHDGVAVQYFNLKTPL